MFTINDHWETGKEQDRLNESLFGTVNLVSYKKRTHSVSENGSCTNDVNTLKRKMKVKEKERTKKAKFIVNVCVEDNTRTRSRNDKVTETHCVRKKLARQDIDKEAVKGRKKKKKMKDKNSDKKITVESSSDIKLQHTDGHQVKKTQIDTNDDNRTLSVNTNFNELYSDSDVIDENIPDVSKRKKKIMKKKKEKEGDIMVISGSNESKTCNGKHKEKHSIMKSNENMEVENDKPTKCKKKKKEKRKKQDTETNVEREEVLMEVKYQISPSTVCNENIEKDCEKPDTKSKLNKKKKKRKKAAVEPLDVTPKNAPTLNNDEIHGNIDHSTDAGVTETFTNIANNNAPSVRPALKKTLHRTASKYNKFQQKIVERLKGGQFRWINQRLYSCKSSDAVNMFVTDPTLFDVYHKGFHSQVQQWPQNPVDVMIDYIKRRDEKFVVADFGCGDATLANSVPNEVHSFDLVAVNQRVTACDMKKVPLPGNCVDIAVFCLSLMGTNLVDFLTEAHRVIKVGGMLKIGEVKSRFEDVDKFNRDVSSLGFSLVEQDDSNKMFILLEFQKSKQVSSKRASEITLNPCIYKRR